MSEQSGDTQMEKVQRQLEELQQRVGRLEHEVLPRDPEFEDVKPTGWGHKKAEDQQ